MGKKSRRKGAGGELEVARVLCSLGVEARRGAQNGVAGGLDVQLVGREGFRVECKRRAQIAALRWLEQAEADALEGEVPVVLMREDRGAWVLMGRLEALGPLVFGVAGDVCSSLSPDRDDVSDDPGGH